MTMTNTSGRKTSHRISERQAYLRAERPFDGLRTIFGESPRAADGGVTVVCELMISSQ